MSTASDDVSLLREALAMGPTLGPWFVTPAELWSSGQAGAYHISAGSPNGADESYYRIGSVSNVNDFECNAANAELIAAANPARIARLLDRLEAAEAEITRLNKCLQYEQHRSGRMGTHGPGCHAWGPEHYECAMAALQRRTELLREALESSVWGYGHLGYLPLLARIDEELKAPPSNVRANRETPHDQA